ncbi:phosphoglycerate kinase, partial [Candidatus Kaiserbacteria bacterium]|nr:phosphoglycerate kinase [Candidatus Kaiserbacteria bacterium]
FVGGALANDLFKAKNYNVGKSLLSDVEFDTSFLENPKILIPIDVETEGPNGRRVCSPSEVTDDEVIYDAGPATVAMLSEYIKEAKTILWNGPFGNFEKDFAKATEGIAKLVSESTAHSVVGGGDTVASISQLGLIDKFDFVSTGGGAMLTYLEHGTTPALKALE